MEYLMMVAVLVEQKNRSGKGVWEIISVPEEGELLEDQFNYKRYERLGDAIHFSVEGNENLKPAIYFHLNGNDYMVPFEIAKEEKLTFKWLEERKLIEI